MRHRMLMALSVLLLAACGAEPSEADSASPLPEQVGPSAVGTRPHGLGSTNKVLILSSSVISGAFSDEAMAAKSLGYTVEAATTAAWSAKSSADFAGYRAIILGDANCARSATTQIATAVSTRSKWGPVVDGNVILVGTDPVYHPDQSVAKQVTLNAVRFATAQEGRTGAYISLSCYYHDAKPRTPVPVLEPFGAFTATGVGCYNDAHIVATHDALAGLTDATLSGWECSVHEAFDSYPVANFTPLAIARDPSNGPRHPGSRDFADGSHGVPYILARGAIPVLCGDGVRQYPEECDTGASNGVPGTACSSVCRLHWCGDGKLDAGEECDTGAANGSGSCSASCQSIVVVNRPPVAKCQDVSVPVGDTCGATVSVDNGSYDPDGNLAYCVQTPDGTLGIGNIPVTLTCYDNSGLSSSCTAMAALADTTAPTLTCAEEETAECSYGGGFVNIDVSVYDACGGVSLSDYGSGVFPLGTTLVTHTARDGFDNTSTCTTRVVVSDNEAPLLALLGGESVTVECGQPYVEPGVQSFDACEGDLSFDVAVSGSVNTLVAGTYTLTYSATDSAGHTGTLSRTVTVVPGASGACGEGGGGWVATASMALPRLLHTATLLDDGRVLVAGGFNTTSELYEPATRTWSTTGTTLGTHRGHTATKLQDGRVLISGGGGSGPITGSTAEVYSVSLGRWKSAGQLNAQRYHHTAVLLPGGKVLVAGGRTGEDNGTPLASAELYDPATNTWSYTGGLNTARAFHTMTLLSNGKVLVTGGGDATGRLLSSAELYDPATGTWTAVAGLGTGRASHTATLLPGGKVLVAGGSDANVVLSASAEVYDPATGTWSATGGMDSPRRFHSATLLPDGRVLVAGGYHQLPGILTASELYDPATGTWSVTEAMNVDRYKHTATLLQDGTVLAVGGVSNHDQASAEYYDVTKL